MKLIRRLLLLIVILAIVVGLIIYFSLDRVVRRTVESQATQQLNLQTTLGSAHLGLFGGTVNLHDLKIASPQGFSAPRMFAFDGTDVKVNYGQLRQDPVHVQSITISKPLLVIEQEDGKLNFKSAMDQIPKTPDQPRQAPSQNKSLKLIIDELTIDQPIVIMKPGDLGKIPGVNLLGKSIPREITINVPTLSLKNIGSGDANENGAAVKDVVMQVITAMADSAAKSGKIPDQLKALLSGNLDDMKKQLSQQFQKQIEGLEGKLPGNVGNLVKNPDALMKDPGKTLQQGVGNLLNNKSPDSAQPSTKPGSGQSIEQGVEGLLGGGKKDKSQ